MSERVQAEKHLAEILFDSMPQQYGQSSAGQIGSHGSGHAGAAGAGEGAGMSVNDDLCEELDKAIMKAKELVAEKNQLIAALEELFAASDLGLFEGKALQRIADAHVQTQLLLAKVK